MRRIFITHIVPQDKVLKYNLSVAACNFSRHLIEGKCFDEVYSILPTFVRGKIEHFDGLIYSNLRKHSILGHFAPMIENVYLFSRIPRDASIWYYNCTILNMILIILLKVLKPRVKQQMIILDYTPSRKPIERFFLWLTNKMNGTIKLADSPLFTVRNTVCLPGVVPEKKIQYPQITTIKKEFLISGALGDNIAMLPMLLEAFSQLPELTLHITGKAPDKKLVEQYSKKYSNIIYHGMIEYNEYLEILHKVPFLLSTRNPQFPENQCNFPSKIIEALLHNRIVISTLHYNQLDGIKYFEVSADKISFIQQLNKISNMKEEKLFKYANQAGLIQERFNCNVWKKWMNTIEQV